jgi:hypothetical protein
MKRILSFITCLFLILNNYAQNEVNVITTAVPFLLINPNGQSFGIADIGVVAASEYYESGLSQNPALLSRNEKVIGAKLSYKPWLRNIVPDMYLFNSDFYYAFSKKIALGYSYDYFSLGTVQYSDPNGNFAGYYQAKEYSHSFRYAQSLNSHLSVGLGLKYIISDLTNGQLVNGELTHTGRAFAGDIGVDYRREIIKKEKSFWRYDFGAAIVNMGNKISYVDSHPGDFLPMQLSIGTMWTYNRDLTENLRFCIDLAYQGEKLLVPTPELYRDSLGHITGSNMHKDMSVFDGALHSFSDAPGGTQEELAEIIHKIGIENRLLIKETSSVALRAGYFHESYQKGNRQYFNVGIGGKFRGAYLDAAMIRLYKISRTDYQVATLTQQYSWNITIGYKYVFKK